MDQKELPAGKQKKGKAKCRFVIAAGFLEASSITENGYGFICERMLLKKTVACKGLLA